MQNGYYADASGNLYHVQNAHHGGLAVENVAEFTTLHVDQLPGHWYFVGGMWECQTVQAFIKASPQFAGESVS